MLTLPVVPDLGFLGSAKASGVDRLLTYNTVLLQNFHPIPHPDRANLFLG